ncbi:MAG: hypothetical protein ACM3U2_21385 [Deltaproteobacteria bacterium]
MNRKFQGLLAGLVLAGWLSCAPALVRAQEAESDEPAAEAEAPAEPAANPPDPKKSPLAAEPKSPDELFDATLLMVDIARLDLAKLYLEKLLEQTLDDDVLMALRDKYGAAAFLKLTNVAELKTSAVKLLDLSNAAAIKQARDPARMARLIDQLEGEPEPRAEAEAELQSLGTGVVPGLLAILHNAEQAPRHASAILAILRVGDAAVPQLVGALDAPGDAFRADVMSLLGELRATPAIPWLWYPALSPDESPAVRQAAGDALRRILRVPGPTGAERVVTEGIVDRMLKSAREHFRNEYAWNTGESGKVTLWGWDETEATIVARQVSADEASDITGLRFAREALALAPQQRAAQILYLCLALAGDIRRSGLDRPLPTGPGTAHDLALSVGADIAVDVIAEAFDSTRPAVAVAALRIFSQIGTLDQMNLGGGRRSIITAALDYPDSRVQFAAATAVLQIDPQSPFRGAPRVVEILKRALASEGRPHAVVGEISVQRGSMIGGFLRELGYEPLVYMSGREAFAAAAARTDVELVVLHPNIIRWALTETLANLRADTRTANIPIVINGPGDLAEKMQRRVQNFRLVTFSLVSETTEDFDYQIRPFLRKVKTAITTPQERAAQRSEAAAWLAHIAQGRRTRIFDITSAEPELSEALDDDRLAPPALEALGEIATRSAQERLSDLVVNIRADVELRRTAALKLAFHIQRFGLLLPKSALGQLHNTWESAREPAELRTAVAGVIGSLKPDAVLAGKRLKTQASGTP